MTELKADLKTELAKDISEDAVEAIEDTEAFVLRAGRVARRGMLAYAGLLGMAYDRAAKRFEKVAQGSDVMWTELVARGEIIEHDAVQAAREARVRAAKLAAEGSERVRALVPTVANDRVEDLEDELETLNRKIKAMNAKTKSATKATVTKRTLAKKAAVKTTAATKAATKKPGSKKTASKKAGSKKAA